MATTSISSITSSSAKYQIVGLGSAFTTAAYQRAGIASSQVATDGSTTAPSGVIAYMAAPASGTSTSTPISAAVTGAFSGGKTYTVYGYVLTKAGQYYRCGSATFTTLIDKPSTPVLGTAYTDALYMTWGSVGGATKYTIRWRIGTGTYSSYTTTNTNTYYTIPNLTANTTYSVSVCAIGANLTSSYSDENTNCKTLTPPVPSVPGQPVISSRTSSSLSLSWTASTGSPTSYTLTYRPTGATDWSYQPGIASNSTVLSGLTGGETYDLAVCALNASGNSAYSSPTVTGTVNPSLSTIPIIGIITSTSIQAKSVTVGVYTAIEIECEYQSGGTWYAKETRAAASDSYTTFSGLSSGVSYRFRSRTRVDTSGGSLYSSYSSYSSTYITTLPTPTATISTISGTTIGDVSVSWSIDAPQAGTNYYINISTSSNMSGYVTKKTLTSYSSPSSIAVDNYSTTYYCQIFATYSGDTTYSNIKSFSVTLTKPAEWSWTTAELNAFNGNGAITVLTQARYNEFLGRINSAISYDNTLNGHSHPLILSTEQMQSDKILYASSFLAAVTKLNNLSPTYITLSYIAQGNDILGQYFTLMQSALNTYL